MGFFSKMLGKANHINAIAKDVSAVGNLATGNTKKATRRVKNKAKGKIANKVFKSLKF